MSPHQHTDILVALAGQPNSGKSTIFNLLTGLHQKVGNYAGVTVEKKSGHYHYHSGNKRIEVVDLPGTYSLSSYSQEERVSRDFILLERPEVIVVIIDASNFQRHLYLVFQLLEMQTPVIVCLNMTDIALRRGFKVDAERCERLLGVPVVPVNGVKGTGIDELRHTILRVAQQMDHKPTDWQLDYGPTLENVIGPLSEEISKREHLIEDFSPRWLATQLLEGDREARRIVQHHTHDETWKALLEHCAEAAKKYEEKQQETPIKAISQIRHLRAEELEKECNIRVLPPKPRLTDRVDAIVCHPFLGLLCIALVMFCTFQLIFLIADGWTWFPGIDGVWRTPVETVALLFEEILPPRIESLFGLHEGALHSLVMDGVLAGIGGVLQFLPLIFTVFFLLSILEQTGFVARISMVFDRIMRLFGLHGQSVLPLILGGGIAGGCAVPAIMATRTMKEPKERLLTILVIPMMNCGAKIPVFALLIGAFFSAYQGLMMGLLVLLSWTIALLSASLLGRTFVRGRPMPLILELPSYLFPAPRTVLLTACRQSWSFVQKAGTYILLVNIALWALMYFPRVEDRGQRIESRGQRTEDREEITQRAGTYGPDSPTPQNQPDFPAPLSQLENSYAGRIGRLLTPVSQWAGFDWRDNVALLGGFAAKEVIVSSLATLYSIDEAAIEKSEVGETAEGREADESSTLAKKLARDPSWSAARALAMIVFVMFYAPCTATCVTIKRETRSWGWTLLSLTYSTSLALILAVAVYQIGRLLTV